MIPQKIQWKQIPDFPDYYISKCGKVLTTKGKTARLRSLALDNYGYSCVQLRENKKPRKIRVHRLVLDAFDRPRQPYEQCRHLDGCKTNNHIDNLKWGTAKENGEDMVRLKEIPFGESNPHHKLTDAKVIEIRRLYGVIPTASLASRFGVAATAIYKAALGIHWSHLPQKAIHAKRYCKQKNEGANNA